MGKSLSWSELEASLSWPVGRREFVHQDLWRSCRFHWRFDHHFLRMSLLEETHTKRSGGRRMRVKPQKKKNTNLDKACGSYLHELLGSEDLGLMAWVVPYLSIQPLLASVSKSLVIIDSFLSWNDQQEKKKKIYIKNKNTPFALCL